MRKFGRNDDGHIHDFVYAVPSNLRISVIAGEDARDTMSIQLRADGLTASLLIHAQDARELGRLLIVAADDTDSR